jgi:hypothetical protein
MTFSETICARGLIAAVVCLIQYAPVCQGAQSTRPVVTRKVRPEKNRDRLLENAIIQTLGVETERVTYYYDRLDLNRDGKPEVLVYVSGQSVCGSGGCSLLVFTTGNGAYKLVSQIALASTPVIVSSHVSNGWNDLLLFVAGGGIQPGYYAVLPFSGGKYPENPTIAPATALRSRTRGVAYLVGADQAESGIVIAPGVGGK